MKNFFKKFVDAVRAYWLYALLGVLLGYVVGDSILNYTTQIQYAYVGVSVSSTTGEPMQYEAVNIRVNGIQQATLFTDEEGIASEYIAIDPYNTFLWDAWLYPDYFFNPDDMAYINLDKYFVVDVELDNDENWCKTLDLTGSREQVAQMTGSDLEPSEDDELKIFSILEYEKCSE